MQKRFWMALALLATATPAAFLGADRLTATAQMPMSSPQQMPMGRPAQQMHMAGHQLIGLASNNTLVLFNSNQPRTARNVRVTGVEGTLLGIDFRPANRMLYGVTNANKIYTIDPSSGAATLVSTLSTPFTGGMQVGVDFNPVADRLRLVGSNGQNFRINVETGMVTTDTALNYASGDANAGKSPKVTAGAYTNSVAGATATQLLNIDAGLDVLALQNPPNDGVLTTRGALGVNFGPIGGMDILPMAGGQNVAFAVSGSTLYSVDLASGATRSLGTIGGAGMLVDLAAVPAS